MSNLNTNNNNAVAICSAALLALGASPINDMEQNTDNARLVSNLYPMLRDDVLRAHIWQCCKKRAILSPEQTPPAFGWGSSFILPADHIRTMAVYSGGRPIDYVLEGNRILANVDEVGIQYIYRNVDEATWDVSLVQLMIARVKWAIAYAITREASQVQVAAQEYQLQLKVSKAADGQEVPPGELGYNNPLLDARY